MGALALAGAHASAQDTAPAPAAAPPQAVAVVSVQETPWMARWEAYGTIRPQATAQAVVEGNGGLVQAVLVEEGAIVALGQPLVQLDATDADIAVREAQTALDGARTDLREQESLLARAQALRDNTPQATLDTRTFAVERAQSAVERAGLALLQAQEAQSRTVVRSPAAGRVLDVEADVGTRAMGGTALATIAAQDSWIWEGGLPTRAAAALGVGLTAKIQSGGRTWTGTVTGVSPRVDANGLALVQVAISATEEGTPLDGTTAQASFEVAQGSGITLPAEALIYRNGLPWVATVSTEGTVAFQPITVREVGGATLLVEGLEEGAQVVANGADFLSDGQRVTVAAPTPETQVAP